MKDINKFIGIEEENVVLSNAFFRLTDEENIDQVFCDTRPKGLGADFNEKSRKGYFNIHPEFKELIFIKKK
jgi:hypothetical protein